VALITFGLVYWLAPQQVGILVYTLAKLSMAGYLGYWTDRWIFPDSRPSVPDGVDGDRLADDPTAAEYRRAAIVCAFVLASGLMS
ncbi:MAG: putative holin, partial [Casimicrobiaceae bacterium]